MASTLPVSSSPDPEAAKLHFQNAKLLYEIGKFSEAIVEYQQAYLYDPKAEFLYNLGQAYRRQGEIEGVPESLRMAKFHFELFLKKEPKTPYRRDVEAILKDLEKDIKRAEEKQQDEADEERKRFRLREEKRNQENALGKATTDTLQIILGRDYDPFLRSGLTLEGYLEVKRGKRNITLGSGALTAGAALALGGALLSFGERFQDQEGAKALGAGSLALSGLALGSGAFLLPYGLYQKHLGRRDLRPPPAPTTLDTQEAISEPRKP